MTVDKEHAHKKLALPKEVCIILTYRCNAKCNICNVWHHPTKSDDEITLEGIKKLPSGLRYLNITGGEPFIRQDITDIIEIVRHKTERIVNQYQWFFY